MGKVRKKGLEVLDHVVNKQGKRVKDFCKSTVLHRECNFCTKTQLLLATSVALDEDIE